MPPLFDALPDDARLTAAPAGWLTGSAAAQAIDAGDALPLAGGPLAFSQIQVFAQWREGQSTSCIGPCRAVEAWLRDRIGDAAGEVRAALSRLTAPRAPFAGLTLRPDTPRIMGIVNVTPDSFYDGSRSPVARQAYDAACRMHDAGADIIDIGGESTRPGAEPVGAAEELERVLPVVNRLRGAGVVVSIDTRRAAVMEAALAAGASLVNDVSALTHDPDALRVAREQADGVVLMHMRGEPQTMQQAPVYQDPVLDVYAYLAGRVAACGAAGIASSRMCVDPGIGFGKLPEHNAALLASVGILHGLGCAVMVGASRKSFIAALGGGEAAEDRLPGSLAAVCAAAQAGVQIVRVHDVPETKQALQVWQAANWA